MITNKNKGVEINFRWGGLIGVHVSSMRLLRQFQFFLRKNFEHTKTQVKQTGLPTFVKKNE